MTSIKDFQIFVPSIFILLPFSFTFAFALALAFFNPDIFKLKFVDERFVLLTFRGLTLFGCKPPVAHAEIFQESHGVDHITIAFTIFMKLFFS